MGVEATGRRNKRMGLALCMGAFVFGFFLSPLYARDSRALKRKELEEVQKQLEAQKKELEQFKREEKGLKQGLSSLDKDLKSTRKKLERIRRDIALAQSSRQRLLGRAAVLEKSFGQWEEVFLGNLAGLQNLELLGSRYYGAGELWTSVFLEKTLAAQMQVMETLRGIREESVTGAEKWDAKARTWQKDSRDAAELKKQRETRYARTAHELQETGRRYQEALERFRELERSRASLEELLRSLEKKRSVSKGKGPVARNSLSWPAEGKVVQSFGRERMPELNTWTIHQGIKIRPEGASAVRSVLAGRVVYAGPFRSYGRILIIDHGQDLFGVYGNLDKMLKAKGSEVRAGEELGEAQTLYFELRRSGDAMDPMLWLKKR